MNTATDPFNSTTPDEYFPIAIERLFPSPTQPRKRFDEAKLKDLAESIKMQGVLQPILVRKAVPPTAKPVTSWPFPSPKIEKPAQPADEIHASRSSPANGASVPPNSQASPTCPASCVT